MKLFIDILNAYTNLLDYSGANMTSELELSSESFNELKEYCEFEDAKCGLYNERVVHMVMENNKSRVIKYTQEELKTELEKFKFYHDELLPKLLKEEPEFPFNGYIFKIKIKK